MATVLNSAGGTILDKPLTKQNRTNAGDPNGSITPQYSGEMLIDTTNKKLYQAQSIANNTWIEVSPGMYN